MIARAKSEPRTSRKAFTPIASKTESVVDGVVDQIRNRILRGSYAPGQRLIEPELVAQLGVSRTALREAFRRLAAEGILDLELYKGAAVRRLTREDAHHRFQVREALEGLAAAAAATNGQTTRARKQLTSIRTAMKQSCKDRAAAQAYGENNQLFHALIAKLADNPVLEEMIHQVQLPMMRIIYSRLLDQTARNASMREHQAIIEAILEGDADGAEAAMRLHVRNSGAVLLQLDDAYFA